MNLVEKPTRLKRKTDKPSSAKVRYTSCKPYQSFELNAAINTRRSERGFTLIEVMVALAILAVVAVAASRASSAYLPSSKTLSKLTSWLLLFLSF